MPRSATGGYLKKRSDSELNENKSFQTQNDLVFKIKSKNLDTISKSPFSEKTEQYLGPSKSLNDVIMVSKYEINNNLPLIEEQDENSNSRNLLETCFESNNITSNSSKQSKVTSLANCVKFSSNSSSSREVKTLNKKFTVEMPQEIVNKSSEVPEKSSFSSATVIAGNFKTNNLVGNSKAVDSKNHSSSSDLSNHILIQTRSKNCQMSGVQPDSASSENKNSLDSQQVSYRVSTSVTEHSLVKHLPAQSNCNLPSSVYGSPASSIEKFLTASQSFESEGSFLLKSLHHAPLIKDFQELCNDKNYSSHSYLNPKVSNTDFSTKNNLVKLRLHIPEVSCAEDSNSAKSFDSVKSGKMTKITSPEILEQHISKIISDNAAIVETLDPKWSRRYLKQSSLSSSPSTENSLKKFSYPLKPNPTDVQLLSTTVTECSKLQSALIGNSDDSVLPVKDQPVKCFSYNPSVMSSPALENPSVEEDLKGSAIKSLLSLKLGGHFDPKINQGKDCIRQHPQNPEGSIIKDLLLKNKAKSCDPDGIKCNSVEDSIYFLNYPSLLKCVRCNSEFTEKNSLDIHLSYCRSSVCHPVKSVEQKLDLNHPKSPMAEESSFQCVGEILKKQLLLPLSRSPPSKRRKVGAFSSKAQVQIPDGKVRIRTPATALVSNNSLRCHRSPASTAVAGSRNIPKLISNESMLDDLDLPSSSSDHGTPLTCLSLPLSESVSGAASLSGVSESLKEDAESHVLPTLIFTPSSPTKHHASDSGSLPPETSKTYLAPARPTSLPLKQNPSTMVGSTLISPETPRPKKTCVQLYLNGHAYTYLGLKCSTRSTYCCIYRPQPMFVPQDTNSKLSMYSNWQTVPAKEELGGLTPGQMIGLYCSKQRKGRTLSVSAKLGEPFIFTHSSYWTYRSTEAQCEDPKEVEPPSNSESGNPSSENWLQSDESNVRPDTDNTLSEDGDVNNSDGDEDDGTDSSQPPKRVKIFEGGFKSNEDYTYVRGRGRGKYVCEECGIRCKKPSMLRKHIRSHTDLRPYKCRHCSFAFKTKGNLTKHMKSKAHHKKCTELGIVPVPTTADDSQIDQEALARQIAKKKSLFSDGEDADEDDDDDDDTDETDDECDSDASSMIVSPSSSLRDGLDKMQSSANKSEETRGSDLQQTEEHEAARSLLHLSAIGDPSQWSASLGDLSDKASSSEADVSCLGAVSLPSPQYSEQSVESVAMSSKKSEQWHSMDTLGHRPRSYSADIPSGVGKELLSKYKYLKEASSSQGRKTNDDSEFTASQQYSRRYSISVAREARKPRIIQPPEWTALRLPTAAPKWPEDQPMDLSVSKDLSKYQASYESGLLHIITQEEVMPEPNLQPALELVNESCSLKSLPVLSPQVVECEFPVESSSVESSLLPVVEPYPCASRPIYASVTEGSEADYVACSPSDIDDSYKQENAPIDDAQVVTAGQAEFIVPSSSSMEEGKCVCRICNKIFAKSSHLRLHVNIHYFERPFRCDNCAVSFRTKGHLQKHRRSVSHYNKVNMNLTFGTPTVDNPRPFKCGDCKIAFRIHGHLAKHLRSKMHIMKLECLGKLPFGMYAEMERSGVSLNEIDTTDCNNSLESLQVMARKLYQRDPRRMRWQGPELAPEDPVCSLSEQAPAAYSSSSTAGIVLSADSAAISSDFKHSSTDLGSLCIPTQYSDTDSSPQCSGSQTVSAVAQRTDENDSVTLNRSSTCHQCGKAFKSAKFLQVHLYSDHPNVISSIADDSSMGSKAAFPVLNCDLCRRVFPNQNALQQHLLSHAQPRPFVCEVCDAGFTSSSSLQAHQNSHQKTASTDR